VEQQTYKVDGTAVKANPIVRCAFSTSTDLLYILLPREVGTPPPLRPPCIGLCNDLHTGTTSPSAKKPYDF